MNRCKIWIDISHIAQLNFYINVIKLLCKENYVLISFLNRGKLSVVLNKELSNLNNVYLIKVGSYKDNSKWAIYYSNIARFISLILFYLRKKPNILLTNGFLGGIVAKIFNIPNIQFGDDPEHKDFLLKKLFATELYYLVLTKNKKYNSINTPKEWAYLNPSYFNPDKNSIYSLGLTPYKYLFVREISNKSLNYSDQKENIIANIAGNLPKDIDVLLSLENKNNIFLYPNHWKILEEPINDIHSLIYYSSCLLSSGDSMAREGALLGVPSIYCGIRNIVSISGLEKISYLTKTNYNEAPYLVANILKKQFDDNSRQFDRMKLNKEFIDINKFIIKLIKKYLGNRK
jgi:uncharacterized protein